MTEDQASAQTATPESGFTYRAITRYWPRIAVGLVAFAGITEWVVGGITADGALELYVFAWASTTGGIWFLFEKADKALSEDARGKVVGWARAVELRSSFESIPDQFALLFDRVFGERHWSVSCFLRSCTASLIFVAISYALCRGLGLGVDEFTLSDRPAELAGSMVLFAIMFNVIPDYLSLLETRWLLGFARRRVRMVWILVADVFITAVLFLLVTVFVIGTVGNVLLVGTGYGADTGYGVVGRAGYMLGFLSGGDLTLLIAVFVSTFFTSVWLWLYTASIPISRLLVRLGGGVGFLLKATDLERQPFRSLGFTSVVLVSLLFLMGLPFVLLA